MSDNLPTMRRKRGSGGISQRHDHPSCPALVNGVRPPHRCRGRWSAQYDLPQGAFRKRRRVWIYGRSKAEVRRKLAEALSLNNEHS